jgi:hypothetical protein
VSLCIPSSSRSPDHDPHRTIYYLGYPLGRFAGLKHRQLARQVGVDHQHRANSKDLIIKINLPATSRLANSAKFPHTTHQVETGTQPVPIQSPRRIQLHAGCKKELHAPLALTSTSIRVRKSFPFRTRSDVKAIGRLCSSAIGPTSNHRVWR